MKKTNKPNFTAAIAIAWGLSLANGAGAETHLDKQVSTIQLSTGGCYFFQLNGVSGADPAVPAVGPWFAIPTTQTNSKEMYAMLLSVRIGGGTLSRVVTAGVSTCGGGGAQVLIIDF